MRMKQSTSILLLFSMIFTKPIKYILISLSCIVLTFFIYLGLKGFGNNFTFNILFQPDNFFLSFFLVSLLLL